MVLCRQDQKIGYCGNVGCREPTSRQNAKRYIYIYTCMYYITLPNKKFQIFWSVFYFSTFILFFSGVLTKF